MEVPNDFKTTFENLKQAEEVFDAASTSFNRVLREHKIALFIATGEPNMFSSMASKQDRDRATSDPVAAYAAHLVVKEKAEKVEALGSALSTARQTLFDAKLKHATVCEQLHGDRTVKEKLKLEAITRALRGGQ